MCARQSREQKGTHFKAQEKGICLQVTSMVDLAILYETLPPPMFLQLSIGWHARSMVMELSGVSLSHLSFACP